MWELYLVYDDEDETEAWVEDISLTGASDEVTIVVTGEDEAYRVLGDNTIELDEDASYDEITARIYNDLGSDYVYNEDTDEYEDYYLYGVDFDDTSDDYPYLYIEWYDSDEDDLDYSIL